MKFSPNVQFSRNSVKHLDDLVVESAEPACYGLSQSHSREHEMSHPRLQQSGCEPEIKPSKPSNESTIARYIAHPLWKDAMHEEKCGLGPARITVPVSLGRLESTDTAKVTPNLCGGER